MFFKIEEQNKKTKIQGIDNFEIKADKRPENEIQEIDKFELEAAKKPANIIQNVYEMNVLKVPRPENVPQNTNAVTILGLEKPENIVESIDEIEIRTAEKPGNEFQHIDEIELKAKEKEQNIIQKTQEIIIPAKQRAENVIGRKESIELLEIERPQIKPELIDEIYLHDVVKPENKIEEKDNFLIEGNNDEEVINANLTVNSEEPKSINTTIPMYNLSNKRNSFLSVSTTASKNSCIDVGFNAYKKEVLNSDENLSTLRHGLIPSFNDIQAAKYSCYKREFIKKQDRRVNNIYYGEEKLKQEGSSEYRNLIKKKIEKKEDQKCTPSLVRKKKDSSIFVLRHESIENNKKSQEGENIICKKVKISKIGEKKDVHKNVKTSGMKKYFGWNIFKLLNLEKKTKIKKDTQSDTSKLHFNILQKKNTGQLERKSQCNNAKQLRKYRQIEETDL